MIKLSEKYSFLTKAETLIFLQQKIKKSKIEKILIFTISEWKKNPNLIFLNISKEFSKKIIVRSSAIGEDSLDSSEAGVYDSFLDVNPKSKSEVDFAIKNVINSYRSKENFNEKNQILIQNQTKNILLSGVMFTRNPENGAPYYIINFEKGGSTTGVTQGLVNNKIVIFRKTSSKNISKKWSTLLTSVKEIEKLLGSSSLDIEWGITKSQIIIFQVRPITSFQQRDILIIDTKIEKLIKKFQIKFHNLNSKSQLNTKQIFSDMTDWNPAEIIGNNSNPLDYSLYDFLIMNDSWHLGRKKIGYHDIDIRNLMVKFGNKPYVDVKKSFVSLMPNNFSKELREKLLNYYLIELNNNPQLHDKVEFDLLFTAYDCSTHNRLKKLKKNNFTDYEINLLSNSLKEFTNQMIQNFSTIEDTCIKQIEQMTKNRKKLLKKIKKDSNYVTLFDSAFFLLQDCRNLGTIPFSSMARISFISNSILKSLQKENHLDQKSIDYFMNSIHSVLYDFRKDLIDFSKNKLSKTNFLKKYGHLRPGTYDILTPRYDDQHSFLTNVRFSKLSFKHNTLNSSSITKILLKYGIKLNELDFLLFVKKSLVNREQLKFEFTHNLSDALELISRAGMKLGFSRKELSYLDFDLIFSNYNKLSKKNLINLWKHQINLRTKQKKIFQFLTLPAMITSEKDFEIIQYFNVKPNFITKKSIISNLVKIKEDTNNSLENKIIIIENADPGFDWIFSKNPSGLITKYGGVASHMAIRCAELGLPGAIGCGDIIFNQLSKASKIILNCNEEKISILQNKYSNKFLEEQKVLKSLGYIK